MLIQRSTLPAAIRRAPPLTPQTAEVQNAEADDDTADSQGAPFDTTQDGVASSTGALAEAPTEKQSPVRPFAKLPELPDDLADALEIFKLAIVSHKLTSWQDVSVEDVLASLDALKELAVAPSDD